jgi:hypothetical protein
MRCDVQRASLNPGAPRTSISSRLSAPERNVRQVCANSGATTASPEWSWPPWLLESSTPQALITVSNFARPVFLSRFKG